MMMYSPGQAVEVRTTTSAGDEMWEPGLIDRIEGYLHYVTLDTAITLPGKAGKKHIETIPVVADELRPAPEPPIPEPPNQFEGRGPGVGTIPLRRPGMTLRESRRMDELEHVLRPDGCVIQASVLMMVFAVGLILGCIIGIATS